MASSLSVTSRLRQRFNLFPEKAAGSNSSIDEEICASILEHQDLELVLNINPDSITDPEQIYRKVVTGLSIALFENADIQKIITKYVKGLMWEKWSEGEREQFISENIKQLEEKEEKQIQKEEEGEKVGSKSAILYNDLSNTFIETYPVKTLEDGDMRIYSNGIYQTCKNKYVANNMMVGVAGEMGLILTPAQIKDALEMVKSKTPAAETATPLNLIPVNNGVLDLDTMELSEYTPENVFLSKFPVDYNPEAKQPIKFLKMLDTTFEGVENQLPIVQEMFGYCFLRSYFIQVAFFLIGNGGNGKGLLLNILSTLLGDTEHVSYLSFKELSEPKNENMLYDLFGKYANICGDTGKQTIKETDTFKKITGKDFIRARRIYKDSFSFKNFAKVHIVI